MSNISIGRKKPRTKETKPLLAGRFDRGVRSSLFQSSTTAALDDASAIALSDAPYVCIGRFGIDFVQLCRRAHLSYIPNIVARPHRPSSAQVSDEKKSIARKQSSKLLHHLQMSAHAASEHVMASDIADGFIPEPPPKTYLIRDQISYFRPSIQVFFSFRSLHICLKKLVISGVISVNHWGGKDLSNNVQFLQQ